MAFTRALCSYERDSGDRRHDVKTMSLYLVWGKCHCLNLGLISRCWFGSFSVFTAAKTTAAESDLKQINNKLPKHARVWRTRHIRNIY